MKNNVRFVQKSGFTLAELLIALALLGIIAAFTIPKVLQSNAEQERVAKLRETVATLEQAWYNLRATNSVAAGSFYNNIVGQLNTVQAQNDDTDVYVYAGVSHPCTNPMAGGLNQGHNGFVQFSNGVVVSGMSEGMIPVTMQTTDNTLLCVDINGAALPNRFGQDIFFAAFNPWGDFDADDLDSTYTPGLNRKAFLWGSPAEPVRVNIGTPLVDGSWSITDFPEAYVGYWLTQ